MSAGLARQVVTERIVDENDDFPIPATNRIHRVVNARQIMPFGSNNVSTGKERDEIVGVFGADDRHVDRLFCR